MASDSHELSQLVSNAAQAVRPGAGSEDYVYLCVALVGLLLAALLRPLPRVLCFIALAGLILWRYTFLLNWVLGVEVRETGPSAGAA